MMNEIKNWAFSLCCASIGGAIFSLLLPDSSVGKVGQFSIRLFLLCCMVLPLQHLHETALILPEIQTQTAIRSENIQTVVTEKIKEQTAKTLIHTAESILEEHQLPYQKIEISINTGQDGSISIDCIRILLPSDLQKTTPDERYDSAINMIKESTGIATVLAAQTGGTSYGS